MDRTPWLPTQGVNTYDLNNMSKDAQVGLGRMISVIFGSIGPFVADFQAGQTPSPSMSVNLTEGQIYEQGPIDANPIGTFAADSRLIIQQGYCKSQTIPLNTSNLSPGQSKWWLIQVQFEQIDQVREGDPTNGIRGFYNSADPTNPLNGIDGLGGAIPTVRLGKAVVNAIAGLPAATGSAIPPTPSGGCAPLFLIQVNYGQSVITSDQIQVAGNAAYPDYPEAPFIAGLLNQHHRGINGHAPQIVLGGAYKEVQGIADLVNLPGTNTVGKLVCVRIGTGDPNGTLAGNQGDQFLQTDANAVWNCITTGTSTTAVWINNNPSHIQLVNSFPFPATGTIPKSLGTFALKLTTADGLIMLPPSTIYCRYRFRSYHNTGFKATLMPSGTDKIWRDTELLSNLSICKGESFDIESLPGEGCWLVL